MTRRTTAARKLLHPWEDGFSVRGLRGDAKTLACTRLLTPELALWDVCHKQMYRRVGVGCTGSVSRLMVNSVAARACSRIGACRHHTQSIAGHATKERDTEWVLRRETC